MTNSKLKTQNTEKIISNNLDMKKNIKKVGNIKMKNGKPTGLYEFSYKSSKKNKKHLGVMAQDVERNNPKAVKTRLE